MLEKKQIVKGSWFIRITYTELNINIRNLASRFTFPLKITKEKIMKTQLKFLMMWTGSILFAVLLSANASTQTDKEKLLVGDSDESMPVGFTESSWTSSSEEKEKQVVRGIAREE